MKKIILFLEDDDPIREHTADLLKTEFTTKKDYQIEDFSAIDLANEFITDNKEKIYCIVSDLNMTGEWLPKKYHHETFGGILTGWVWLYRFVFNEKEPEIPTVIYSGFLDELMEKIPSEQKLFIKESKRIECVAKGSDEGEGFSGLIKAIKMVTQKD